MRPKPIGGLFVLLSVVVWSSTGCSPQTVVASEGAQVRSSAKVERGSLSRRILLTGQLEAVESEQIRVPRTPAWEVAIQAMVEDGTLVEEGQVVLELDNSPFTADLDQKRIAEVEAYNNLARKRSDVNVQIRDKKFEIKQKEIAVEKARLAADVPEELLAARDFQQKQLDLARNEIELQKAVQDLDGLGRSSQAEVEALRLELKKTQDEIEEAEEAIDALSVKAPRSGILVVEEKRWEGRKYQIGDMVSVGRTIQRIPDLSEMRVVAHLSDVDEGRIGVGMRATCTLDTYPERSYPGRVIEIADVAQEYGERRRSFRVTIALDEADPERMRPGMSIRAEVQPEGQPDTLLVDRRALFFDGRRVVARTAGGEEVEVRLGACDARRCEIREGLEEGRKLEIGG